MAVPACAGHRLGDLQSCGSILRLIEIDRHTLRKPAEIASNSSAPETASVCRDWMVADAVLKNQSAEAEFC